VDATESELAEVRAMLVRHGLLSEGDGEEAASSSAPSARANSA
jgi:hypothetical protein